MFLSATHPRLLAVLVVMYSSFYLLLLSFSIWSALVVYSQETFPFVSFTEQTLVNHDYVDLNEMGRSDTGGNDVRCITDLNTCCSASQGVHRGNWYFPNGTIDCYSLYLKI